MKNPHLLFVIIASVTFSCNSSTSDKTSKTTVDTAVAAPVVPAAKDTATTLSDSVKVTKQYHNIIILPTTDATEDYNEPGDRDYDDTALVSKGDKWYDKIATYGAAYVRWLAPKGWTGHGDLYTNGGMGVKLYPIGGSESKGPRIIFTREDFGGSVLSRAAPYFPKAMEEFKESYDYHELDKLPAGIKIKRVSKKIITYILPADNGLITQGVVFYGPDDYGSEPYFREATIILPADQSELMEYLVKWHIKRMK